MSYFEKFPKVYYNVGDELKLVTDITVRNKFLDKIRDSVEFYVTYSVPEGQRPEHVSSYFYKTPFLHWIILLFNEVHDPYFEWPQSQEQLISYCKGVYGEDIMYQVRHYEIDGNIVGEYKEFNKEEAPSWVPPSNPGPQDPRVYPVSHYEYEEKLNDQRREIRVLKPEVVNQVIREFGEALGG